MIELRPALKKRAPYMWCECLPPGPGGAPPLLWGAALLLRGGSPLLWGALALLLTAAPPLWANPARSPEPTAQEWAPLPPSPGGAPPLLWGAALLLWGGSPLLWGALALLLTAAPPLCATRAAPQSPQPRSVCE